MKRTILILAAISALACYADDSDFARLQSNYKAAIAKANEPIIKTYVAELRKLLERQTKGKDLAGAKITMDEIETLTGAKDKAEITGESNKELERMVVGRTWRMVGGAKFSLRGDGKGARTYLNEEVPVLWRVSSPNVVEVTGKLGTGDAFRTFYFKFVSLQEAYYGDSPTATNLKLALE